MGLKGCQVAVGHFIIKIKKNGRMSFVAIYQSSPSTADRLDAVANHPLPYRGNTRSEGKRTILSLEYVFETMPNRCSGTMVPTLTGFLPAKTSSFSDRN
jgi:hypothetical protein